MRIADGFEVLNISAAPGFQINPSLLWDESQAILIDAGAPFDTISAAIEGAGIPMANLKRIIITHQDMDHIGGISRIKKEYAVEVMAHGLEIPHIQGEKPNIKMTPEKLAALDEQIKALPEEQRKIAMAIRAGGNVKVDVSLKGGEVFPYCGGIEVIHVPGHTPGHICLYLKAHKALIAGDSMNVSEGRLVGPTPQHSYGIDQARTSLNRLLDFDIDTIVCHHGGVFKGDVRKAILDIIGI